MFSRLLLLFIFVPLADLVLLFWIADWTHWTTTVLLVVLSGIVGAWLAKRQTKFVGMKIRDQMVQNQLPSGLLTDGAMIMFAAGLLITPGLITDVFGLSLLIPQTRAWYKKKALKWIQNHFNVQVTTMSSTDFSDGVVEGEVVSSSEKNHAKMKVTSVI